MFNSFPQPKPDSVGGLPSMLDWSAYQTVFDWTGTTVSGVASGYSTFVNVPSGEGWLLFVQAFNSGMNIFPIVKVTVDGVVTVFSSGSGGQAGAGNMIIRPIYFKKSLMIEVFNSGSAGLQLGCDYTYLLKTGSPNTGKQTLLSAGSRNSVMGQSSTASLVDVINIAGSGYLTGLELTGVFSTGTFSSFVNLLIDGVNKMNQRRVFIISSNATEYHHFDGPIRFNNSLQFQHRVDTASNGFAISKVFYTLD